MKKYMLGSKILRIYFMGFLTMIVVSVVGFAVISNRMYTQQVINFCENVVRLNLDILDNKLLSIQESQRTITEDSQLKKIIEYRSKIEDMENIDYSIELFNQRVISDKFQILIRNREIENAYIVNEEGDCFYWYKKPIRQGEIAKELWYQNVLKNMSLSTSYISEVHDKRYLINPSKEKCISMVMPIILGSQQIAFSPKAYLICDVNLKAILDNNVSDIDFALLNSSKQWYYFNKIEENAQIQNYILDKVFSKDVNVDTIEQKAGEDLLLVSMKTKFFGLQLMGIKELTEASTMKQSILKLSLMILIIAIIITIIISRKTVRTIINPVKRLMKQCNEVANGNYNVEFGEEKIEEMIVLSDVIQGMIKNVVYLNEKMIEEEKKFSEQKLKALQHQINPHFVNNVLQSMKGMALRGENKKISDLSTYLGKIMAYSVYQPYQSVTLKEELQHVENYLKIQSIRYDNKVLYSIECNSRVENTKILKLTLQPIVENAVEHGMKLQEREFITISAEEEGEMVCIIISDNGKGISEEKIKELQRRLVIGEVYQQEKSVGILNVNERIKKKFGDEYGLEIISRNGSGTTVIVKLPKEHKEEQGDESISCR